MNDLRKSEYEPAVGQRRQTREEDGTVGEEVWRGKRLGWHPLSKPEDAFDLPVNPIEELIAAAGCPTRLETDSAKRKDVPIYSGFVRYFPDAMAEVARLSKAGNDKHNPGEPIHWSRGKSDDHLDCLMRHLAEVGNLDDDGFYHDVKVAWRALTHLQSFLERVRGLPISPGSKP
jgi:hypothetical protein